MFPMKRRGFCVEKFFLFDPFPKLVTDTATHERYFYASIFSKARSNVIRGV